MDTTPDTPPSLAVDDFRIRQLRRDPDALLLILVGTVVFAAAFLVLAFLPDQAWERLTERVQLLWVAGAALIPICLAAKGRFDVRRDAAVALGVTAAAVAPEIARNELYAAARRDPSTEPVSAGVAKAGL